MRFNRLVLCLLLAFFACKKRESLENPALKQQSDSVQQNSFFLTAYSFNDADQYVHEDVGQFPSDYKPEDRLNSVPQILESINNESNKTEFLNLGADYAYFNEQGILTSYTTQRNLKENCYPILLREDLDSILYLQPDADWDDFLSLAPSLDFIGAGEVCIDENGRILELNNNSYYGTQIPTLANFVLFLRYNGFVFSDPNQGGLGGWGSSILESFGVLGKSSKSKSLPAPRLEIGPPPGLARSVPTPIGKARASFKSDLAPNPTPVVHSKPESVRDGIRSTLDEKKVFHPTDSSRQVDLSDIQKGTFLEGGKLIGKGGFGDVYKVQIGDNFYAVKVLRKKDGDTGYEADVMKEIDRSDMSNANPGGIPFHGAVKLPDGQYALVYDLAEGSLSSLGRARYTSKTGFNGSLFWSDAEGLAHGVKFYHEKGMVLRDWKNENILVGKDGLKIADYGGIKTMTSNISVGSSSSGSYTRVYSSPWRLLAADIKNLEMQISRLKTKNKLTSFEAKELKALNKKKEKKLALFAKYHGGLSARELMVRDDIYSCMVALFEQRTGRQIGTEYMDPLFHVDNLTGKESEGMMALELNKTSLRNAGLTDAEIAFFQKGLNMNPSKGGFASMDEVLVELRALRNESSPFGSLPSPPK